MPNTIHSKEIARELLAKNILNDKTFSISELFQIRDASLLLAKYGLEDKALLEETLCYIEQKTEE